MLKLGAETEITWRLSGGKVEFYGSELSVSYKDSLNVLFYLSAVTKYIQTMHIHNINLRLSDMIKFNYRYFNFFHDQRIENR